MDTRVQSLNEQMGIDTRQQLARKQFMGFSDTDENILLDMLPEVKSRLDIIVDDFYQNFQRYPELNNIITNADSSIDRLRQSMRKYLLEMFQGNYTASYFESRCRIGSIHSQIGVTPRWFIGSMPIYLHHFHHIIEEKYHFRSKLRQQAMAAVGKIFCLDLQLAMDAYTYNLIADLSKSKIHIETHVKKYGSFIGKVAAGNLKDRIEIRGDDEVAILGQNLNNMTAKLATMAGQTKEASQAIITTLNQVKGAITSQSSGASEQAAAVIQTTATLQEIKATSSQTLEKAKLLGKMAERTHEESEQGLEAVKRCVEGMNAIRERVEGIAHTILALSEQTQQIGDITAAVTGLAQQLKMLALNASIEAAKAGESGKGFGVVASEVKELAEQSQQSTAQVQKILQDIRHATDRAVMATEEGSKGVDQGVELVAQSGETMQKLGEVIRETTMASQQIVAAVGQEVAGIDQVTIAMREIKEVTSQFVSDTEQTKQATSKLMELAEQLGQNVSAFKL
ncbi:protoglobin domain-containing protein [Spartinivicinus poritis]|uniref:Methyl-accepting chemotaxis protein n=1 Tax=Spartinivicinus poritis TaxID=2994640 RepID=A0ABT5UEQ5_9GAMM|nr:protoglobin domain-containing protein [Spartinivicinus sp. A2-2]MDE1464670.1 methyl-accepting chemotaxis protein [Spartinivicinus sp. A2-2]